MRIEVINARHYRPHHAGKLREALTHFQNIVNSDAFQNEVLLHPRFITNENLTNNEILSIFLAGQELNSTPDNEADLDLELDPQFSTDAVGYTIETAIYTYENMFEVHSSAFLAGHYAHEYCHTLGFRDPDSLMDTSRNVPYEIGRIVSELATGSNIHLHFMDPATPTKKKRRKKRRRNRQ